MDLFPLVAISVIINMHHTDKNMCGPDGQHNIWPSLQFENWIYVL